MGKKRDKKGNKKRKQINKRAILECLDGTTQTTEEVLRVDENDVQRMCEPHELYLTALSENMDSMPQAKLSLGPISYGKAGNKSSYRKEADNYSSRADHKFQIGNFKEACNDYFLAVKIMYKHGNIEDRRGRDMKLIRFYQDRGCLCMWALYRKTGDKDHLEYCLQFYNSLIQNDPGHALWYKRRALITHDDCKNFMQAYKDYASYIAMLQAYNIPVKNCELENREKSFRAATNWAWDAVMKRVKSNFFQRIKPYLNPDWINMWALCPCNDVLLEDFLSVFEELKDPTNKSFLAESGYKKALKRMALGYHSYVVDILIKAYSCGEGLYRAEAFLLLSLIYSQIHGYEVQHFLNEFEKFWVQDQYKVPTNRRKQIFMRYISLGRGISSDPFKDLDLSMFSNKEQAQFYLQTALTVCLRLQILDGTEDQVREGILLTMVRFERIKNLCERAIAVDKDSLISGLLREYAIMRIAINDKTKRCTALNLLVEYIESNKIRFQSEHKSFACWCLFYAYYNLKPHEEALNYAIELKNKLLFPGSVATFIMMTFSSLEKQSSTGNVLDKIDVVTEWLDDEPENFYIYQVITDFYYSLNCKEEVVEYGKLTIKYWPHHFFPSLKRLLANLIVIDAARIAEINLRRRDIYSVTLLESEMVEGSAEGNAKMLSSEKLINSTDSEDD
ncbi:unnamed protein product [Thelazia callipaeda]|uniref:TPR_REGION domain-containing protein n=1 Tax=Thelazia callipaeda TaxID=103827 RepID=A0A158RBI4_THECL|nr:unnamed protein product [Thelazia callipaeda]